MFITVALRDQTLSISCGPATQPLRWLADVACLRYDAQQGQFLGPPTGLRTPKGVPLDLNLRIIDALKDGDEVVVVLNHDIEEEMRQSTWHQQAAPQDSAGEDTGDEGEEVEAKEQVGVEEPGEGEEEEGEEEEGLYSDDSSDEEELESPAAHSP